MSTATPLVASLVSSPSARFLADLDPSYRLSTGRLLRIYGPIEAAHLTAALSRLPTRPLTSTSDAAMAMDPLIQVDTLAGADPFTDAVDFLLAAPDPEPVLRARLYDQGPEDRLLLLAGNPTYVDHQVLASWAIRLRHLLAGDPDALEPMPAEPALHPTNPVLDAETDWAYWCDRLSGELPRVDLTGRIATGAASHGQPGHRHSTTATSSQARRWRDLTDAMGTSPEVLALGAVAQLLRRYLPETDQLLAVAVAGWQGQPETMLPLRFDAPHDVGLADLLNHVASRLDEALNHRGIDPSELVRRLNLPRVLGRTPLDHVHIVLDALVLPGYTDDFAVSFGLGIPAAPVRAGRLQLQPVGLRCGYVPGELRLSIATRTAVPQLAITTPPGVPGRFGTALAIDLGNILDELALGRHPADVLTSPAVVRHRWPTPARAHQVSARRAHRSNTAPLAKVDLAQAADGTIASRFQAVAMASPGRTAVLLDDGAVSYADLAALAGGFAAAISAAGAGRGDRVGLLLDQSATAIAAMLGTLAAGAAYVPLDPSYPAQRMRYIQDHAEMTALVTTRGRAAAKPADVPGGDKPVLPVVYVESVIAQPLPHLPQAGPDDPAYLLYTSGSTGRPKGVMQTHRGVLAGIANHIANFAITPDDRLSMLASFSYDMAVSDLYGALLAGAAVAPIDVRRDGLAYLIDRLDRDQVTIYHSTPTLFRYLTDAVGTRSLSSVRAALLGGEESTAADVSRARRVFGRDCVFVNGYGATEATFAVQQHLGPAEPVPLRRVPIGYPLPGYEIDLRDPEGRTHALAGEVVIRSRFVAPGYWREPDLTAQRFGVDGDGTPWYRTGDLARRLPDGRLLYLGRLDRQVKVRGYRVELGEIEALLAESAVVARAVAFARTNSAGEPELYACVQPQPSSIVESSRLRAELADRLPEFAVPRAVVVCDELPLTPTGKVDVAAILIPAATPDPADPGLPRTATERVVATAWQSVLSVPHVAVTQNFFDAGGHSLLMALVQQRLIHELGRPLPLVKLFAHPTIRDLATFLDTQAGGDGTAASPAARSSALSTPDDPIAPMTPADPLVAQLAERMARRRQARSHLTAPARREVAR